MSTYQTVRRGKKKPPQRSPGLPAAILVLAVALTLVVLLVPILAGRQAFFLRDLETTHRPALLLARELGFARMNPAASFGQVFRGNPNLLVYYRAPIRWLGVDAHLVVHWLWGLAGMIALLRARNRSWSAALAGSVTLGASGYVLSSLAFLNSTTTIAWLPWTLWAVVRRGRCTTAILAVLLAVLSLTGEPALILGTLVLAGVLAARRHQLRRFAVAGTLALLVTLPVHVEEWRTARDAARVARGYTLAQVTTHALHPARLLEIVLPGLFGTPDHLVQGAWWGFRFSGNTLPYIYSVSVPLLAVLIAACSVRRARGWALLVLLALGVAMGACVLQGSPAILPFVALFRYPIKLTLFATLGIAVLAADGLDYWWSTPARLPARVLGVVGACLLATGLLIGVWPSQFTLLLQAGWDAAWHTAPDVVLAPIANRCSLDLCFNAGTLLLASAGFRYRNSFLVSASLALMTVCALAQFPRLAPTIDARLLAPPSAFAREVARLPGPVCELAVKDLDPIRQGLRGTYPADDAGMLALAQERQAWALSAAPLGVRYAYNNNSDGSYTLRNQLVQEALEAHHNWDYHLKWLRANSVAGIIAPGIRPLRPGLVERAREDTIGIPVRLYQITDTLPSARRVGNIAWVRTPAEGIARFGDAHFNERTMLVVEAPPQQVDATNGTATITEDAPDQLTVQTTGVGRHLLFIARTFTSTLHATLNGQRAPVYAANVHLCAIPVPSGTSTVTLRY